MTDTTNTCGEGAELKPLNLSDFADVFERPFTDPEDPRLKCAQVLTRAEAEAVLEHRGNIVEALTDPRALTAGEAYGWQTDLTKMPAALTLLFKAAPDEDGMERVWLVDSPGTPPSDAVAWSYLPDVIASPQPARMPTREQLVALTDFIDQPSRSRNVEPPELRNYRHDLMRLWEPILTTLLTPSACVDPTSQVGEVRDALAWYGEQARLARLIHSEGDAGRNALAADGGKRALAALKAEGATGA